MPSIRQRVVATVTRRYPFYSGCGTLANHPFVRALAGRQSGLAWARISGGNLVPAPLGDYVGRAIYFTGELDRKITWICSRIIRAGDTVLDIGANLGSVTFLMSALVGQSGRVHAFEPNPRLQELIDLGVEKNGTSNITLHRIALGAAASELELTIPADNAGCASLVPARHRAGDTTVRVPVVPLSEALADAKIERLRLVKIDVEGYEPQVLEGAADLFSKSPPDAILFELNDNDGPLVEHPTMKRLSGLGYGFFSIPRCFVRMRLELFDPENYDQESIGHDFLGVRLGDTFDEIATLVNASR